MLVWPHDLFCDLTFGEYISHRCMYVTWMDIYFYGCGDRNTSSLLRRRRFGGFLSFVCVFAYVCHVFSWRRVWNCTNNFFIVCFLGSRLGNISCSDLLRRQQSFPNRKTAAPPATMWRWGFFVALGDFPPAQIKNACLNLRLRNSHLLSKIAKKFQRQMFSHVECLCLSVS